MENAEQTSSQEQAPIEKPDIVLRPRPVAVSKDYEKLDNGAEREAGLPRPKPNTGQQIGERSYRAVEQKRGFISNVVILLLVLLIILAIYFFVTGRDPLLLVKDLSSPILTPTPEVNTTPIPEPDLLILGQHNKEVFTFDKDTGQIQARTTNSISRPVAKAPGFEKFLWHETGKLLLISAADNPLGNIYLFDLAEQDPQPEIPTARETSPNFPRMLQIDGELPVSWSQDGGEIAFVVRDQNDKKEWLFIYEVGSSPPQLIYTPARSMDRISSLLWITDTLIFVGVSNGQEALYRVNYDGGEFQEWGN
jgi:hypothetical protein